MRRMGLLALLALGAGCEDRMERSIDEANYCATADECVDVGSVCPFGCNILVNEAEADRIDRRLGRWPERCAYDCMAMTAVECVEGQCVGVYGDTGL